jgi:hypothetical protein
VKGINSRMIDLIFVKIFINATMYSTQHNNKKLKIHLPHYPTTLGNISKGV